MRLGALAFAFALLAPSLTVEAKQDPKLARIGYLSYSSAEDDRVRIGAFQQGLRDLGYVEGKNIVIERRYAVGSLTRFSRLAEELVRLKVDVFFVHGDPQAVKKVSSTIPIVHPAMADPVGSGHVASLARPGGNITGLSDQHGVAVSKRLQLLKEMVPLLSVVAVLWTPEFSGSLLQLKTVQAAAPALGLKVLSLEVTGFEDLERAFSVMDRARPGAILIIPGPVSIRYSRQIAEFAIKSRIATIGTVREHADSGFLMAYGTNFVDLWRRSANYIAKILKGANPGELPVEQASKWDLVINLKTAKAIRVTVHPSIILRADDVIE